METSVIAKLTIELSLDDATWVIEEGDMIEGLTYRVNSIETSTITAGRVRVIQANTRFNENIENSCPPEPYVQNYITITNLVVDISKINDADLIKIPVKDIIAIKDVKSPNEIDSNEISVNMIFNSIPGMQNDGDRSYSITISNGLISDTGLFDMITSMKDFTSITVSNKTQSFTYQIGEDLEIFKSNVDTMMPKTNDDPTSELTINIIFG